MLAQDGDRRRTPQRNPPQPPHVFCGGTLSCIMGQERGSVNIYGIGDAMNQIKGEKVVRVLPPHLRPKYETVRDLRLMARAVREGWVIDVPEERKAEWANDVVEMMRGDFDIDVLAAVVGLYVAVEELNLRFRESQLTGQPFRPARRSRPRRRKRRRQRRW